MNVYFRLQWNDKDMELAMQSVNDKRMTLRGAAKKFSVPYSTLKDRVQGRVMHGTRPGVKRVFCPEEEEELVDCIKVCFLVNLSKNLILIC